MSLAPQSVAYKESGIPWLGKIPKHWEMRRVKYVLDYKKGKNPKNFSDIPNENIYLTMEFLRKKHKKILYIENTLDLVRVSEGDILLLWDGANAGEFISAQNGYLASTMAVIKFNGIEKDYAKHFLVLIEKELRSQTNGMGIPHVSGNLFENLFFALPPLQEQKAIADFLDKKTHQIEDFITKKQKLITLLEEKKQTLINQCVTQGLDSSASLKDSGVEWLGKIPTHWEMIRLGIAYPNTGSGTTPRSDSKEYYDGGSIVWVNSGDLNDSLLINSEKKVTEKALKDYPTLKIYPKNSIVVAMYGATIGKASVLGVEACVNQACCVLPKSSFFEYPYVFYWFVGSKKYIIEMGVGGGQPNISQEIIKNLKIPLPPLEEQKAIAEYLDTQIAKMDLAISKIKSQINLIKEYKSTLISEAVCGRVGID